MFSHLVNVNGCRIYWNRWENATVVKKKSRYAHQHETFCIVRQIFHPNPIPAIQIFRNFSKVQQCKTLIGLTFFAAATEWKNVDFLFNFIKFFKLSFSLMDANWKIKTIFTNSFPRIFYREKERVGYSEKEGKNDRIINNNKVWQISKVQKHGKFKSEVSEKILKRIKGQQRGGGGGMLNWERFITINLSPHGKAD